MSNVLEKVLSRFSYVKNLEEENGKLHDAVEKNCRRADRMGQDLEYYKKQLDSERDRAEFAEAVIKMILDKSVVIFSEKSGERYINVYHDDFRKYRKRELVQTHLFPQNAVKICLRKENV